MVFARRTLVLVSLMLGAGLATVNAGSQRSWVKGIFVGESPLPLIVPDAVADSVAKAKAEEVNGVAVKASGNSMMPLYRSGVIMIIARADYDDLKRGQTVVYENSKGRTVAHILVAKCNGGWRVTGLNNRNHDGEGVNPQNLRGVVVDAVQPQRALTVAQR